MKLNINKEMLKVFGGTIAFTVCLSLGARKIVDKYMCHIDVDHAHKYTAIGGMERYTLSENTIYELMLKSKDVKYINSSEKELIDFLDKYDLYVIEDNIDKIKERLGWQKDFTEYQKDIETVDKDGKKVKTTRWTTNSYKNNGNARDCYYVYEAYKVVDENGELKLERSGPVSNILDIKDEYPYVKLNYYKVIRGNIYKVNDDNKKK